MRQYSPDENPKLAQLLSPVSNGEDVPVECLFSLIYEELRHLAHSYLARERVGHTLQPTALVHEAYLKLSKGNGGIDDETHYKAVAARAMRQVLVDHARARVANKRGGGAQRVTLNENLADSKDCTIDILVLDQVLNKLDLEHQRMCKGVELRFFSGLKETEIAVALNVSQRTVRGDWAVAKLWLSRELDPN